MPLWSVPEHTQRTPDVCWEACGRMMWDWRHRDNREMQSKYALVLFGIVNIVRRLNQLEMDVVYTALGLRHLVNPKGKNIRHALSWSPVVVPLVDQQLGHAVVVSGSAANGYVVVDPCGVNNGRVCQAANESTWPDAAIEGRLSHFIWYW